ncbi:OPT oligopeptide transporter protein-domain-containing protein [Umbelopsis sp. AD052]|nr:OPT oligopeptide transporter protein-domain-containing protein [Umbelopsis sp. AD052]
MPSSDSRNASIEDTTRAEDQEPMILGASRSDGYGLLAGPSDESHFTIRAVLCGLLIGTVMCFSNMYFGLQTGWISMMSLQSSLLGYAMFKPFKGKLRRAFGPIENVVLQTTAVATATMPLAAGFVGIIPALQSMTEEDHPGGGLQFTSLQLIVWSLGVAFFGVFFAIPLRTQTIIREKLRFPSGTATAQMISILHQRQDPTEQKVQLRLVNGSQLRHRTSPLQEGRPLLSDPALNRSYSPPAASVSPPVDDESDEEFEAKWALKWRALLASFSISSAYTVTTYFFPIAYALPIFNWLSFGLIDFKAWDWYFTPSLSYVGQGIIMGLPTTLSMLLGCVVGWGILSPIAHFAGWAPGPVDDWKDGSKGWILWISLGVMIAESFVSLTVVFVRSIVKSFRGTKPSKPQQPVQIVTGSEATEDVIVSELDESAGLRDYEEEEEEDAPPDQLVSPIVTFIGLIFSTLLCLAGVAYVFGTDLLPLHMTFVAVVLAMILSVLGVRALGETDLNPVSGLGKISQVCFAAMMPGGIVANLVAGGIAEAGAQQAGDLMQDLKTGHLLRASPKAQFYGQMIGSFFSVFVSTAAYKLYTSIYEVPGKEFPAPTAAVWLDMSRLVNGRPLPPHVLEFVLAFSCLFGILVLIKETTDYKWRKYIPQGIAFAIGIYNPPNFTLARVIGGWAGYAWDRYCDGPATPNDNNKGGLVGLCRRYREAGKVLIIVIASGFVLGEGTFALFNLCLRALGVPHF